MKTLLKNARILTMEDGRSIFNGDVVVTDDVISYVGEKAPEGEYERVIDCESNLLMPGFKNAHTHSPMTFLRSYADDLELHSWLFDRVFPLEAKLSADDQYHLSKVAILEYLTSGITACFDMYYNPLEMARASEEMGFRTVLLGTVTKFRESVAEMEEVYNQINGKHNPLVTYMMGFHAEYTTNDEILSELSKASHRLKCPIYTHSSETYNEVEECKGRHDGLTPTEYMDKLGLFDYGGGAFHCVAFSDHDIEIFKKRGLTVVTCPGSNAKLASGIAPLCKFDEAGLNLAIGTDGPASNNALDFFYEMRLACVLQKLASGKAESFDALKALKAATVGGSKALRLDEATYIKEGQKADIIMIDLKRPSMQPINNIEKNLVYSGSKDCVKMTMIAGRVLYMDGKFAYDVDSIYEKAQEITDKIKSMK